MMHLRITAMFLTIARSSGTVDRLRRCTLRAAIRSSDWCLVLDILGSRLLPFSRFMKGLRIQPEVREYKC